MTSYNKERYILAAVATGDEQAAWDSLEELSALLETADGEAACLVVQNLDHPNNATYVGSGKTQEIKELLDTQEADGVICDDELSPSQFRNLSEAVDAKVLDRTMLILDIFARHARTREGKIQVEIAQQKYRLSRLRGMGESLSRLGGGIGTRGPGETKLETDRRVIQRRIKLLSDEIEDMKQVRETTRKKRLGGATPTVALVGYTNAGKSTLLNAITGSDVLSEDKLFATLDPTTRNAVLPDGQKVLFTDTVGFINKLPHSIIDAFRSTLEEAKFADVIVHVVDASDEQEELHCKVVNRTLHELNIVGKPLIVLRNKIDILKSEEIDATGEEWRDGDGVRGREELRDGDGVRGREELRDCGGVRSREELRDGEKLLIDRSAAYENSEAIIDISARTGEGIDEFYKELSRVLQENRKLIDTVIDYKDSAKLAKIRKYGQLLEEKYEADGIHIKAYVPAGLV